MKIFFSIIFILIAIFLLGYAALAHLVECSASHTGDFFGDVYMFFFGIPGIILLSIGIGLSRKRKILLYIFGVAFAWVFIQSMLGLPGVPGYMQGSATGFSVPWAIAAVIYLIAALRQRN